MGVRLINDSTALVDDMVSKLKLNLEDFWVQFCLALLFKLFESNSQFLVWTNIKNSNEIRLFRQHFFHTRLSCCTFGLFRYRSDRSQLTYFRRIDSRICLYRFLLLLQAGWTRTNFLGCSFTLLPFSRLFAWWSFFLGLLRFLFLF